MKTYSLTPSGLAHLKQNTQASNRWLCEQLHMGTPGSVSQLVSLFRHHPTAAFPAVQLFTKLLAS